MPDLLTENPTQQQADRGCNSELPCVWTCGECWEQREGKLVLCNLCVMVAQPQAEFMVGGSCRAGRGAGVQLGELILPLSPWGGAFADILIMCFLEQSCQQ